jgi:hypothetical protein
VGHHLLSAVKKAADVLALARQASEMCWNILASIAAVEIHDLPKSPIGRSTVRLLATA